MTSSPTIFERGQDAGAQLRQASVGRFATRSNHCGPRRSLAVKECASLGERFAAVCLTLSFSAALQEGLGTHGMLEMGIIAVSKGCQTLRKVRARFMHRWGIGMLAKKSVSTTQRSRSSNARRCRVALGVPR